MPLEQLLLFVGAGLLLNLTPGPDVLYIVANALRGGARVGMVAAVGITTGCFVHIFAAAVGVSALMAASATAFSVLKWIGAAYLVYVGCRLLLCSTDSAIELEAAHAGAAGAGGVKDYRNIFLGGFWANALNPKVALFFLAFLPQFIGPTVEHKPLTFLLLGMLFNFNGLWVNLGWALAADRLALRLRTAVRRRADPKAGEPPWGAGVQHGGLLLWLDRTVGALFIGFGIKLALMQSPNA
jgi:threonine/homoserine/homoserine lactone efflux protein